MGPERVAACVLESRLGGYTPRSLGDWVGSEGFASGIGSGTLARDPDVWTDGSLVRDEVEEVCCGGAGVLQLLLELAGFVARGGHLDLLPPSSVLEGSNVVFSFLYPSLCKQFKELNFGESLLFFRPQGLYTWVLIMPM